MTGNARPFRFYDNRQKYLAFVNTCDEKWKVAERAARELHSPSLVLLVVFRSEIARIHVRELTDFVIRDELALRLIERGLDARRPFVFVCHLFDNFRTETF